MFDAVLFDLDGTLLDSALPGVRALAWAVNRVVADGREEDFPPDFCPHGKTDPIIFDELFRRRLSRPPSAEEEARCRSLYIERLQHEVLVPGQEPRVLPGVAHLLERLSRTPMLIGLGTGNVEEGAFHKLRPTGLDRHFSFGGYGSDAPTRLGMLQAARKRAEAIRGKPLLPSSFAVVGDTARDIEAAKAFGAPVLAVATGPAPLEALQDADLAVATLEDPAAARFLGI